MKMLRRFAGAGLLALVGSYSAGALAQTVSNAVPAGRPAATQPPGGRAAPDPSSAAPAFDIPMGQGPGVHGANSPFAPLNARDDVVAWSVLTAVKTRVEKNRVLPVFNMTQIALNQKTQRVQGFMMPLDPGATQKHFLLSSVPLTCAFCLPGGPESMVEVKTTTPVKYTMEPVVVEGRFVVLSDDPYGLYYRMTGASSIR